MLEPIIIYLINHWEYIKRIILYSIPLIVIFCFIIGYLFKNYITNNWKDFKTNPFFLFFGGYFNKYPNETSFEATQRNFTEYLSTFIKEVFNFLMIPIYSVFNVFLEITKSIYTIIDKIRNQMAIMRNFLMKIVSAIFNKITNGVAVATYMFMKIRDGLRKQFGLFNLVGSTVEHSYYFIYSLLSGPLGDMGRYGEEAGLAIAGFTLGAPGIGLYLDTLCFKPDTPVELQVGYKLIYQIMPGDILKNNNKVLAIVRIKSRKQVNIYKYHGVEVTGDHLVYSDTWTRVNQLTNCGYTLANPKLNCLITTDGTLSIQNQLWRDYTDSNDFTTNNMVQTFLIKSLNCSLEGSTKWAQHYNQPFYHNNEMVWGFHPDTIIYGKKISDIRPGELIDGREVKAIIIIDIGTMYVYKMKSYDVFVSGNVTVNDGKWNKVFLSSWFENLNDVNDTFYYNIIIDNSLIEINGVKFRDYLVVDDPEINGKIDNFIETALNYSPKL